MITLENVEAAIEEAERFAQRARVVRGKLRGKGRAQALPLPERRFVTLLGPDRDVSACRRASMDLTVALARLRSREGR
jgi:hypothetical protein